MVMQGLPGAGGAPSSGSQASGSGGGGNQYSAGNIVASGAMIGTGVMQAVGGIKKGGARGISNAIGGGLQTAAGIAAMIPGGQVVAPFLEAGALAADLIGSLFQDPRVARQNQINTEIAKNQYLAPTALNVTSGMDGTYVDIGAKGDIRTSTLSAFPSVAEPYITSRRLTPGGPLTYYNAPGNVITPYSGSPSAATSQGPVAGGITLNVSAIDSQSFDSFLQKPSSIASVAKAVTTHLQRNNSALSAQIKHVTR